MKLNWYSVTNANKQTGYVQMTEEEAKKKSEIEDGDKVEQADPPASLEGWRTIIVSESMFKEMIND